MSDDVRRRHSADDVLRYLTAAGSDSIGALIVGEPAFQAFLERASRPPKPVAEAERSRAWPDRAANVLAFGVPGSSAAGERPKFLATVVGPDGPVQVLVKFSPQRTNAIVQRVADLLICEALALDVVAEAGVGDAASARVLEADGRVFLEVERFDRVGALGRRGLLSLLSLDAEYVGSDLSSWSRASRGLVDEGLIEPADDKKVRCLLEHRQSGARYWRLQGGPPMTEEQHRFLLAHGAGDAGHTSGDLIDHLRGTRKQVRLEQRPRVAPEHRFLRRDEFERMRIHLLPGAREAIDRAYGFAPLVVCEDDSASGDR